MIKKIKKADKSNSASIGNKKQSKSGKKVGFFSRVFNYCKEIKSELKKVVWPTKKGLLNGILTVFVMVFIVVVIVVLADLIFHNILKILYGVM